jgi:chromosome segregation ATPase
MSTDENAINSAAPHGPAPAPLPAAQPEGVDPSLIASAPELAGLGDGALGFISSIQGQLAELGRIASETARRAAAIDQRETALLARSAEIHIARQKVEQMGAELASRQQAIEDDLAKRSHEFESRDRALSERRAELERQLAMAKDVEAERASVQQARQELAARQEELAQQRASLQGDRAAMENTFAEESARLHDARASIEASTAQLAEARARLDADIKSLEEQRASIQGSGEKLSAQRAELESRERALAQRAEDIQKQAADLATREAHLEDKTNAAHAWQEETDAELAKHEQAVNQRERELEAREQELNTRQNAITEREQQLKALSDQAQDAIRLGESAKTELERIESERQELVRLRTEVEAKRSGEQAATEQREKTFNQRLASLQKKADAIDEQQRAIDGERAACEASLRQSEQLKALAEAELSEARKLMNDDRAASQRLVVLEQDQAQLKRALSEETARRSHIERAFAELEESAAGARREAQRSLDEGLSAVESLDASRARCIELERSIQSLEAGAKEREAVLSGELDAERQKAQSFESRIAEMESIASQEHSRIEQVIADSKRLSDELVASQARVRELSDQASQAVQGAGDATKSLQAELDAIRVSGQAKVVEMASKIEALERTLGQSLECQTLAEQSARAITADHEAAVAELAQARASLASAVSDADQARAKLQTAEQELAKSRAEVQSVRTELAAHSQDDRVGEQGQRKLKELGEALVKREDAIRVLSKRVEEAELRIEEAERRADEAEAASKRAVNDAPGAAGEFVERVQLRHARLARYKKLLSAHAMKIVKAKAALEKKGEQYNELLSQQNRIMEAATALKQERARVQSKLARSQSASMLFFAVGTIAIVAVGSWFAATKMAPATFAARTTLIADGKGRVPSEDDLRAWTASHEKMFEDPQFFQLVAERFAQRGMTSLGTAPSVAQKLKADLSYQTDTAGKLTLEMRSQGQERTVRELETVTLAVVSVANAQREARGDGAATAIDSPPIAGNEPIADQRMLYVATFGGGGLLLSVIIWLILYRVLAQSKRNFEQQLSIET